MKTLSHLSDDELDALLLGHAMARWLKVAMVVGWAMKEYPLNEEDEDRLSDRIAELVNAGKLESAGNIRKWRFSEIRLPSET